MKKIKKLLDSRKSLATFDSNNKISFDKLTNEILDEQIKAKLKEYGKDVTLSVW